MAAYEIFRVMYTNLPAFHEAIYIEFDEEGGRLFQVIGSIHRGFTYDTKTSDKPEATAKFYRKFLEGTVDRDRLEKVHETCQAVRVPCLEYRHGIRVDQDCRTWVRDALKELRDGGILQPTEKATSDGKK